MLLEAFTKDDGDSIHSVMRTGRGPCQHKCESPLDRLSPSLPYSSGACGDETERIVVSLSDG